MRSRSSTRPSVPRSAFDVFDRISAFGILADKPGLAAWRQRLAARPSVAGAVAPDYPDRLLQFLEGRGSHMSRLVAVRPQRVPA